MNPPVLPLFDSIQYISETNTWVNEYITHISLTHIEDAGLIFAHAFDWLLEQQYHENNYKAYRSELTTFLHWSFDCQSRSIAHMTRKDIGQYVRYCQSPPIDLIGYYNVSQFIESKELGGRIPNAKWRPFIGKKILGKIQAYKLSDNALKTKLAILSSFYTYLMGEDYCEKNPAQVWMNHSRFSSNKKYVIENSDAEIKAFSELQWSYIMEAAQKLATNFPITHQRSLFLIRLLYSCYLRISEISARVGYTPVMGQFRQNKETGIWTFYIPQSKGGKKRSVAVSKSLLAGLKEYRLFLGLSPLPNKDEITPLFIRHKAANRGRDCGIINANLGIRQLRDEVQFIIKKAADNARQDGLSSDADIMEKLTAHNIRHTGITHDINLNQRPLSHVQADAGHDSIDTTSKYIHTTDHERFETAANKSFDNLADFVN